MTERSAERASVRVVVAPDKFKGSLSAAKVATALARGLRGARPGLDVVELPVADGGDGTLEAAVAAGYTHHPVEVTGPTGEPVPSGYAVLRGDAVVEMADACGLQRLPGGRPAPTTATSRGLGEAVAAALDGGCTRLFVGIGGSASTDGGAGMLTSLGARLLDAAGEQVAEGGAALATVASLDLDGLDPRLREVEVVVACDVTNPLLGRDGAAAVFGPQKGADPDQVAELDAALARWADVVGETTGPDVPDVRDHPGAGAAGGVGFAALALLGARLEPGIDLVLDLLGFEEQVAGAALVVTGEGQLDSQSLAGKAPLGVAAAAGRAGVRTVAVSGHRTVDDAALHRAGILAAYALTDLEPDVERCIRAPEPLLERLGAAVARHHLDARDEETTRR